MPNAFDYLVSKYSPLIPFRVSLWFSHFLLFLFISSARNEKMCNIDPKNSPTDKFVNE